jgi:hypothetical protein
MRKLAVDSYSGYQKGKIMKLKYVRLALVTAGSLIAAPLIVAQQTQQTPTTPQAPATPPDTQPTQEARGRGGPHGHGGFGFGRGFPLRGLALGTTATLTFYDGDPATGGAVLNTLTFTYGEDSEVALAEAFETARASAAYLQVALSEQTRTVDLSDFADDEHGDLRPRELGRLDNLNDGATITASFYSSDPETAGATATETLTFTYGVSSAAGFADDFANAAETNTFVTITSSPQTYTVNLAEVQNRDGRGPRGPRQDGFRFNNFNEDDLNQNAPTQPETDETNS